MIIKIYVSKLRKTIPNNYQDFLITDWLAPNFAQL